MSEHADPSQDQDAIRVELPVFEGPLDLLLHLVRTNRMDIFDIPIIEVARQYDQYIDLMKEMNLEIAGEFLLMASTLAHIKSKMLLPPDPSIEGEEAEDPRAELSRQLVEHERFKVAAENLQAIDTARSVVWARPPRSFPDLKVEPTLVVDLYSLMSAFKKLMDQAAAEERLRYTRTRFPVSDKLTWLLELLDSRGSLPFRELMAGMTTRDEMVATFLALLELMRVARVVAHQRTPDGEIWVTALEPEPAQTVDSETPPVPDSPEGSAPSHDPHSGQPAPSKEK